MFFLVAASMLTGSALFALTADQITGSGNYTSAGSTILRIEMENASGSLYGHFLGNGTAGSNKIIKTGGGTFEYAGWSTGSTKVFNINYAQLAEPPTRDQAGGFYCGIAARALYIEDANAFNGDFIVKEGTLMLSGYLNQWAGTMTGANSVILEGSARLSLQNSPYNIFASEMFVGGEVLTKRFNVVRNLKSVQTDIDGNILLDGSNNPNYQRDTTLNVGMQLGSDTSNNITMVYIDQDEGSVGRLEGMGDFVKAGSGNFKILNDGPTFAGNVILAGGVTISESAHGQALASAYTVNLAGANSTIGLAYHYTWSDDQVIYTQHTAPGAAGSMSDSRYANYGSSALELVTDQTIHNLQSLYRMGDVDQPIHPRTGTGTAIILNENTLTLFQDEGKDGLYNGSIVGGAGAVFEKRGAGALALFSLSNSEFQGKIKITEGRIVASARSLGIAGSIVEVGDAGTLTIVQNSAGTLQSKLTGALGGELVITSYDYINNYGYNDDVMEIGRNPDEMGSLEISSQQDEFFGTVIASEGISLIFSADNHDAFVNASGIILSSGSSGRETTVSFNNTSQHLRNLQGDANTSIDLGTGSLTLEQNDVGSYAGKITGVGSLIKTGTSNVTLLGKNTYYGATVVQTETLRIAQANGIENTSGVILLAGTVLDTNGLDQHIGALFGETNSILNISSGNILVGVDDHYLSALQAELALTDGGRQDSYYFDTTNNNNLPGFSTNGTRNYLQDIAGLNQSDVLDKLSFSGQIIGTGKLTKIGKERLTLSGASREFSGAVEILGGFLRIEGDSLPSVSGIYIGAEGQLEMNQEGADETFAQNIFGEGAFAKVGSGTLHLTEAFYSGDTYVKGGNLILDPKNATETTHSFPGKDVILGEVIFSFDDNDDLHIDGKDGTITFNVSDSNGTDNPIIYNGSIVEYDQKFADIIAATYAELDPDAINTIPNITGYFVKTGGGTMILKGDLATAPEYAVSYTGSTIVEGGTLVFSGQAVNGTGDATANIPGFGESTLLVANGATLVLDVADTSSLLATPQITAGLSGDGVFQKTGIGTLEVDFTEDAQLATYENVRDNHNGTYTLENGTVLTVGLNLEDVDVTVAPVVFSGVTDSGGGIYTLADLTVIDTANTNLKNIAFNGQTGELTADRTDLTANENAFTGVIFVEEGTLSLLQSNAFTFSNELIIGASVSYKNVSDNGNGTYTLADGKTVFDPGATDLLNVVYDAGTHSITATRDATVLLNNNDQTFGGLSGEAGAVLVMGSVEGDGGIANIIFDVADDEEKNVYYGIIDGIGAITKKGAGMISLQGDNRTYYSGVITVEKGILEATTMGLGDSIVTVNDGGVLQLFSNGSINTVTGENIYDKIIGGFGEFTKTGAGDVWLRWDDSNPQDAMPMQSTIYAGTLIVDSARKNNIMPNVEIFAGAKFQINLQTASIDYTGSVVGDGSLIIDGQGQGNMLVMRNSPTYKGLTSLQNTAKLDVSLITTMSGGLSSDVTGVVDFGNHPTRDFYLTQSEDAEFSGTFIGQTKLVIDGKGRFAYLGPDGKGELDAGVLGDVTVAGGKLQVGVTNQHAILVERSAAEVDGTLYINVGGAGGNHLGYNSVVTGEGHLVKNGTGTLNATDSTFGGTGFNVLSWGVEEGTLVYNLNGVIPTNTLITKDSGNLELTFNRNTDFRGYTINGGGQTTLTGTGTIRFADGQTYDTDLVVGTGATLIGRPIISGDLTNDGGTISPGTSIGNILVGGDFVQTAGSTLLIELGTQQDMAFTGGNVISNSDRITYNTADIGGAAILDGNLRVAGLNGVIPQRGSKYAVVIDQVAKSNGTVANITGTFIKDPASNVHFVTILPEDNADLDNPYHGLGLDCGVTVLVTQEHLADVVGYKPHKGLEEFLPIMDDFSHASTDSAMITDPAARLGALLNATSTSELSGVINNLSPLGYSSLIAMTAATANSTVEQLESRMEQRRYDRTLYTDKNWQTYFIGSTNFVDNRNDTSSAIYNFNTYGGIVGADNQVSEDNLLGAALEYAHGQASMHAGGGKMKMDSLRATGYISRQITPWYFVDAGVSGGYMDYDVKRETLPGRHGEIGRNKASPEGWSVGAFAFINTALPLDDAKAVHLKPFAGFEFNHYGISAKTETGGISRLNVNDFSMDSLRGKIGTGLAWFVDGGDWVWKFNIDVAYAHEFMDTSAKIDSAFVVAGNGTDFTVNAKAFARDVFQVGPSVTISLTETCSIYANYRLELGVDGETYNNINFGFRSRF